MRAENLQRAMAALVSGRGGQRAGSGIEVGMWKVIRQEDVLFGP